MVVWGSPSDVSLALREHDLHVWRWPLAAGAVEVAVLKRLLSPDEVARAERFHFARHHDAFVVARAGLRKMLGRYLSTAASEIEFLYGDAGKPELSGRLAGGELAFNLSHSGKWALCAVGRRGPLGVDVERLRPMRDADGVARRYFAAAEVAAWECLAEADKPAAFFRCWTRKEAYLKALGDGLRAPLDRFVVSLAPGDPPCLIEPSPHDTAAGWSLADIDIGEGYVASLVAPAGCRVVRWFDGV